VAPRASFNRDAFYSERDAALELASPGGTTLDMRTGLVAFIASIALAACGGGDEPKTNATNDDDPQSTPTVAK
jgi:hypothetical protein